MQIQPQKKGDNLHEIFYKERDYDLLYSRYRKQQTTQCTQQELLLIAKSQFLNEQYQRCFEILIKITPSYSTKVLFQRQSLLFRALYLLKRKNYPSKKQFNDLYQIIGEFDKLRVKTPGQPLTPYHLQVMQNYRKFVQFLQKYSKSSITYNQNLFVQQESFDKKTHKYTGFPCYLISQQWLEDYGKMKAQSDRKIYLGPITNFALINDIFQAHTYESELDSYKNVYIFPINKYKVVSKKLWALYCGVFSPEHQFCPIKRLYNERSYTQYYNSSGSSQIIPFVPVVIECDKNTTVLQLTGNQLVSKELIPVMQQKYGFGQLKDSSGEQNTFNYFYFGQRNQKILSEWTRTLTYQRKKLPDHLKNILIFRHLSWLPISPTTLLEKESGLKGLQNLGNSCYMNSCLQCLSFTKQVVQNLTTKDIVTDIISKKQQNEGQITLALSDLLKQLWRASDYRYVSPFKFKKYFGIKNTMFKDKTQEDAHEFLLSLLNSIHEDIKIGRSKVSRSTSKLQMTINIEDVKKYFNRHQIEENKSLITQNMRGIFHTTILCKNCKTSSHSFDLFLALSLPIPYVPYPTFKFYFIGHKSRMTYKYEIMLKQIKTINDVFLIFQKEVLQARNQIKLSETQLKQQSKKNYIMIHFDKQKDSQQIWNSGSENKLTLKQIKIQELIDSGHDFIIYQVQAKMKETQQLILVEYKFKQMFSQKSIGFPRFIVMREQTLKNQPPINFKKLLVQNDLENRIYQQNFQDIKAFQWNEKAFTFKYTINAFFRRQQKLYLQSSYIDKQLNSTSDMYNIKDCFKQMGKPQILQGWECGKCKSNKSAQKMQLITQTNKILIITLKRFQANGNKIRNMIEYPLQKLDMRQWLQDKNSMGNHLYDLYGVCLHTGTMEGGHYRAYCKHFVTGQWYQFDDERVKKIQINEVISPNAYMLFYRLRDF